MSTTDDPIELLKAERAAADLAYYFGTTDLHDKYEATQAATYTAIESLVSELAQMKRQVYDLRSERDALRAQLDGMTTEWSAPDTASVKTVPFWVGYGADERMARSTAEALSGPVYKRLVGPWVEVE